VQASIVIRSAHSEEQTMDTGYQHAAVGQNVQQQVGQHTRACGQHSMAGGPHSRTNSKLNWMNRFS